MARVRLSRATVRKRFGRAKPADRCSATNALTLATPRKQRDHDQKHRHRNDDPERERDINDDAKGHDGYKPRRSITEGKTPLHVSLIGEPRPDP
jgi:hypothetical protein